MQGSSTEYNNEPCKPKKSSLLDPGRFGIVLPFHLGQVSCSVACSMQEVNWRKTETKSTKSMYGVLSLRSRITYLATKAAHKHSP